MNKPATKLMALKQLSSACLEISLSTKYGTQLGKSYAFGSDLELWARAIVGIGEVQLINIAQHEYVLSLFNSCEGQYRNSFRGLRLVLEICIQSIQLSVNPIEENEWKLGHLDTKWSALSDEIDGPLGARFCRAFFPELANAVEDYRKTAIETYRELSECVHGNTPNKIPLPIRLEFDEATFLLWNQKAANVRTVVHFALAIRYLKSISKDDRPKIDEVLLEQFGHIRTIREECTY